MSLYFITGNAGKFREVKALIPEIEQLEIHLPEIQSIDPHEVITAKLTEARAHHQGEFIVEDTSVYLECFDWKLPGPLIKNFLQALGNDGLVELAERLGKLSARVECLIGYTDGTGEQFFLGTVEGSLVKSRGESNFGWDKIFIPTGSDKTFGEISQEAKNQISHRRKAVDQLKTFLDKKTS